jgi:hypothetical protein
MATFLNQHQILPQEMSAEQEAHRRKEAQDLFKKLQSLLLEGETPAMDVISEALKKFEELSLQISRQSHLDPEIQKIFEDVSALVLSARQMAKNKGIAERLQRIADETQKVTRTMKLGPHKSEEMTQDFFNFMNTWRPVFYLLVSSREFRFLLLDSIRLAKRVVYNYSETLSDEPAQKFLAGDSPQQVAQSLQAELKEKGKPEISDEEWERIQDDLQRVLAMLSKDPTYRQGLERLFVLLDLFQKNLLTENQTTSVGLPPVTQNVHAQKVIGETEELISMFSGKDTLELFKFHLRILIQKTREDERIHSYLLELKQFTLKARSESEIKSEAFKQQSQDLARRGQELFREFKTDDLRPFLDSANLLIENIKNDEFLQLLRHHAGVLKSDLSYVDMEGKPQLDMDMLSRLQTVLLPVLADALKYLPLPRISSSDAYREFWLDKIVLCSYDIIPENIKFHLESDSEFSFKDIEVKDTHTFLVIQLKHFRTELKDIQFYYKKKTFPELEDKGRVTFRIKGDGANLTLNFKVEQKPEDKLPRILEGNADFDISDLDIEFDTSTIHHTVLVPMLTKMFKLQIKLQLEKEVENNLKSWMQKLGNLITNAIVQTNRPFLSGLEAARKAMKATEFGQIYQKRVEKLE